MPDYIVTVCRTAHGSRDFLVKGADNEHQAQVTAETKAANFEFSEKHSDYEATGTIELEPGQKAGNIPDLEPIPHEAI